MCDLKRILFWVTFIPACVLVFFGGILYTTGNVIFSIGEMIYNGLDRWENWCSSRHSQD